MIKKKGVKIMKPISTNNMSAWGYIGLMILFSMPYVGTPALILFAIFGQGEAKSFARAYVIIAVISIVIIAVALVLGVISPSDFSEYLEGDSLEVLRNVQSIFG